MGTASLHSRWRLLNWLNDRFKRVEIYLQEAWVAAKVRSEQMLARLLSLAIPTHALNKGRVHGQVRTRRDNLGKRAPDDIMGFGTPLYAPWFVAGLRGLASIEDLPR